MNRLRRISTMLLLASLPLVGGCNVLGAIAYKIKGPDPVEALHKPAQKPTLILADSSTQGRGDFSDADAIARYVNLQFQERKIAPTTDIEKVFELRTSDPQFGRKSMAAVGRAVGAEQVVYVDLKDVGVEQVPGSGALRSSAAAEVRVVDANTGALIWPMNSSGGHLVSYETPMTRMTDRINPMQMRTAALVGLADAIAKCFYDWKPGEDAAPTPKP